MSRLRIAVSSLVVCAGLAACGVWVFAVDGGAQCQSNADCTDERICDLDSGQCVEPAPGGDAGSDAGAADGGVGDAGDAGRGGEDSGVDAGADAGSDAGSDGGVDGGDGGPDAGQPCGGPTLVCDAGAYCLQTSGGPVGGQTSYLCVPLPRDCGASPTCSCIHDLHGCQCAEVNGWPYETCDYP